MWHSTDYDFSKHIGEEVVWKTIRRKCNGVVAPNSKVNPLIWLSSEKEEMGKFHLVFEWTEHQKKRWIKNNIGEDPNTGIAKIWTCFELRPDERVKIIRQREDGIIVCKIV